MNMITDDVTDGQRKNEKRGCRSLQGREKIPVGPPTPPSSARKISGHQAGTRVKTQKAILVLDSSAR